MLAGRHAAGVVVLVLAGGGDDARHVRAVTPLVDAAAAVAREVECGDDAWKGRQHLNGARRELSPPRRISESTHAEYVTCCHLILPCRRYDE